MHKHVLTILRYNEYIILLNDLKTTFIYMNFLYMFQQYDRGYYGQEGRSESTGYSKFNPFRYPSSNTQAGSNPSYQTYDTKNFAKHDQRGDSANCIPKCFAEKGPRVSI